MLLRFVPAALLMPVIPSLYASPLYTSDSAVIQVTPVVVTASRITQTVDDTLAPVTVITRQDIERVQAQSIEDVLRGTPGITISNNGGQGKITSLFLRGTNSDHVLVLVDGVKTGSATTGTTAFQDIPVELIDHIEIVRGPRSSLYGSEAIGGVIQIFTRKGRKTTTPSFSIGAGSHSTQHAAASVSGKTGSQGWYSFGVSGINTKGFNACKGSLTAGCYTIEPDNDGYRNLSGRLRLGWRFTNGIQAEVNSLHAAGDNKYDGTYSNEARTGTEVLGANLKLSLMQGWHVNLLAGQSHDNSDNFLDGVFKDDFKTRRETFSWLNNIRINNKQHLVAGIDWQNDHIDSAADYSETSRNNTGGFAQYVIKPGNHSLQFSLRRDRNQQFGLTTTGEVAWGYLLTRSMHLTVSLGNAFKAPTFNELYYPGFGNADLQPEKSRSLDLGLSSHYALSQWSMHIYETRIVDLIGFDANYVPININTARIRGIEAYASTRFAQWNLQGQLNLLDPTNEGQGTNNGNVLPRRVRQVLSFSADQDFDVWSLGFTYFAAGSRYEDLENRQQMSGYATLDLRTEYHFNRRWRVQGRIKNLFDKEYETAYLFNQPGREVLVTLRYQP